MKCLPLYFKKIVELRSSYDFSHIITYNHTTGREQSFNDQPAIVYFDNYLAWKNKLISIIEIIINQQLYFQIKLYNIGSIV